MLVAWWRDMPPGPWKPYVGFRIPGSLSCGWKPGALAGCIPMPPPPGGFLRDPWCDALSSTSHGRTGDSRLLVSVDLLTFLPQPQFPCSAPGLHPLHPGRLAGCPSPSSPCLPRPLVNSFGSWLWVFHLGSKQEAVWREGGCGWEGGQSDLPPPWHPGELRSTQDSSDRPSSNLRVSL